MIIVIIIIIIITTMWWYWIGFFLQQYDDHVTEIYSEHEGYDFTPTIQTQLEVLGERAHLLGFHEICSILYYDECDVAVEEIGVVADHGAIEY